MAKYQVECKDCKKEMTVQLYGKERDRQWKIDNFDWQCDACRQKAFEAANAAAAAKAEEAGLPELEGTEKQVAWAESIRVKKLDEIASEAAHAEKRPKVLKLDSFEAAPALRWIAGQKSASWWIDRRARYNREFLKEAHAALQSADPVQEQLEADANAEATIRPTQAATETVAEITPLEKSVAIRFPEKREDFRQIVRFEMGYHWDDAKWVRNLDKWNGTPQDRAAEAGAKLLAAGFIVRIHDAWIRAAAVSGNYEPECRKWIKARVSGKYAGWFSIDWRRPHDYYKEAKRLPAARYDKPDVVVPAEHFEEVMGFAEIHGFRLSNGARQLADKAAQDKADALVASPNPKVEPPSGKAARPEMDAETPEIPDELLD